MTGLDNHLLHQVKLLLRHLCTLFGLPLSKECFELSSPSTPDGAASSTAASSSSSGGGGGGRAATGGSLGEASCSSSSGAVSNDAKDQTSDEDSDEEEEEEEMEDGEQARGLMIEFGAIRNQIWFQRDV